MLLHGTGAQLGKRFVWSPLKLLPNLYWEPQSGLIVTDAVDEVPNRGSVNASFGAITTARPANIQGVTLTNGVPRFDGASDAVTSSAPASAFAMLHQDGGVEMVLMFVGASDGAAGYILDTVRPATTRQGIAFLYQPANSRCQITLANGGGVSHSIQDYLNGLEPDEWHTIRLVFGSALVPNWSASSDGNTSWLATFAAPLGAGDPAQASRIGALAGAAANWFKGDVLGVYGKHGITGDVTEVESYMQEKVAPRLWYRVDVVTGAVVVIQSKTNSRLQVQHVTNVGIRQDCWRVTDMKYRDTGRSADFHSQWERAFHVTGDNWMSGSHGNEELTAPAVLTVDGVPVDLGVAACGAAASIVLTQQTNLLDPTTGVPVATVTTTHTADFTGLTISCALTWSAVLSLDEGYCAMLPLDQWAVNRSVRNGTTEVLSGANQVGVTANTATVYGTDTAIRALVTVDPDVGFPQAPAAFVQIAENPNKLYFDIIDVPYATSIGEIWSWSARYSWTRDVVPTDIPLGVGAWDYLWDADHGRTGDPDITRMEARLGSAPLLTGTSPSYGVTTFTGDRPGVVFVDASSEYLLANEAAVIASGNDTVFSVAMHLTIDTTTSSDTIFGFGTDANDTHYLRIRVASTGNAVVLEGRGEGDGAVVTSASSAPVVDGSEYTLVMVRNAATWDLYLNGVKVINGVAFALGDLGVLTRFSVGALVRTTVTNFAGMTLRRLAIRSGALAQEQVTLIHTAWFGN